MAFEMPCQCGLRADPVLAVAIVRRGRDRHALGDPGLDDLRRDTEVLGDAGFGSDLALWLGRGGGLLAHWRAPLGQLIAKKSGRAARLLGKKGQEGPNDGAAWSSASRRLGAVPNVHKAEAGRPLRSSCMAAVMVAARVRRVMVRPPIAGRMGRIRRSAFGSGRV